MTAGRGRRHGAQPPLLPHQAQHDVLPRRGCGVKKPLPPQSAPHAVAPRPAPAEQESLSESISTCRFSSSVYSGRFLRDASGSSFSRPAASHAKLPSSVLTTSTSVAALSKRKASQKGPPNSPAAVASQLRKMITSLVELEEDILISESPVPSTVPIPALPMMDDDLMKECTSPAGNAPDPTPASPPSAPSFPIIGMEGDLAASEDLGFFYPDLPKPEGVKQPSSKVSKSSSLRLAYAGVISATEGLHSLYQHIRHALTALGSEAYHDMMQLCKTACLSMKEVREAFELLTEEHEAALDELDQLRSRVVHQQHQLDRGLPGEVTLTSPHGCTEEPSQILVSVTQPLSVVEKVFLVFSISGYRELWETFPQEMSDAYSAYADAVRLCCNTGGAQLLCEDAGSSEMGGGYFLVSFKDTLSAVRWALSFQLVAHCLPCSEALLDSDGPTAVVRRGYEYPITFDGLADFSDALNELRAKDTVYPPESCLFRGLRCRMGISSGNTWSETDSRGNRAHHGIAIMKASLLCGSAYGGELAVSEDILSADVQRWASGLGIDVTRRTAYVSEAVTGESYHNCFKHGEQLYCFVPPGFTSRREAMPSLHDVDHRQYNPNWFLYFGSAPPYPDTTASLNNNNPWKAVSRRSSVVSTFLDVGSSSRRASLLTQSPSPHKRGLRDTPTPTFTPWAHS